MLSKQKITYYFRFYEVHEQAKLHILRIRMLTTKCFSVNYRLRQKGQPVNVFSEPIAS